MQPFRPFASPLLPALVAVLVAGCSVAAAPSVAPSAEATAEPTVTTSGTPASTPATASESTPVATSSASPDASGREGLGPPPTLNYPDTEALGIGTIALDAPSVDPVSFWLVCEWTDTSRARYFYPERLDLLDEPVHVSFVPDGPSVDLRRAEDRAPYAADESTTFELLAPDDWTSGSITFRDLPLNAEGWGLGPLPTPKEMFEQPLGGRDGAKSLDGTVSWECGEMPDTVPTPGPSLPEESSGPAIDLPESVLTVGDRSVSGVTGCGLTWWIDGTFGGADSCGTTWAEPGADRVLEIDAGGKLRFGVPEDLEFERWSVLRATQAQSDYWNGLPPPLEKVAEGRGGSSVEVDAPPPGEWVLVFSWTGSNDRWRLEGVSDHFRVVVR